MKPRVSLRASSPSSAKMRVASVLPLTFNRSSSRKAKSGARAAVDSPTMVRLDELICDGVLLSTPAGSTAYNLSAHGPILPINAPLMVLTPISPFRPRRWRGAILPTEAVVVVEVLEPDKRPVSAVADNTEFRDVLAVEIREASDVDIFMMFDPGHSLAERILREQFDY